MKKHWMHGTLLYKKWKSMRGRVAHHPHYIKNNIGCCKEWDEYAVFYKWAISHGYKDGLTLDRINTYKGYSPENCRWVDKKTQSANIRLRRDNNSGFSGVSFDKQSGKYKVQIQINRKKVYLGRYKTAIEGAIAFDKYVIANNTDHRLNFDRSYYDT